MLPIATFFHAHECCWSFVLGGPNPVLIRQVGVPFDPPLSQDPKEHLGHTTHMNRRSASLLNIGCERHAVCTGPNQRNVKFQLVNLLTHMSERFKPGYEWHLGACDRLNRRQDLQAGELWKHVWVFEKKLP